MNDNELFEQARIRIQKQIKGRCISDKDIIVEQEKEIMYYRKKIQNIIEKNKTVQIVNYDNIFEISINNEQYIIRYNNNTNIVELNIYLIKLINEKDKCLIMKDKEFKIINATRMKNKI